METGSEWKSAGIMKPQRNNTAHRNGNGSRDAGIVVGASVVLSVIALVVFAATLPG